MLICELCLLILIVKYSSGTTSIKTFPTIHLRENVPINTKVINLTMNETTMVMTKKWKLILLNLGGFERNLFKIENETILTINEIDREQMLIEKRCFDRMYCLIELHILVNDGQEYWVIPIHIVDENDNKPQFKKSSIELIFELNNLNENKIVFEGGNDSDEGKNSEIFYLLDCSKEIKEKEIIKLNKRTLNCFPLFDLIIFSKSSIINQNDQLGMKLNPSVVSSLSNEYNLILFAFNLNERKEKEEINSMKIKIKINKNLEKPKFICSEYKFLIKNPRKGQRIGKIDVKPNIFNEKILFRLINVTKDIEMNSMNGELILLNDKLIYSEMNFLIESFYLINQTINSFTNIQLIIRSINKLNENLLFNYQLNSSSSLIKQINNNSNEFIITQKNLTSNEFLLNLTIISLDYPLDQFHLSLINFQSLFSLSSSSSKLNNYFLKIEDKSFIWNLNIYLLIIKVKHQLTNEVLSNLTIKLILNDSLSLIRNEIESLSNICVQNSTFDLYQNKKFVTKVQVIETNENIFSFSTFHFSKENSNEIIIDQCRMMMTENLTLNQSQYQLCSNQCFSISLINQRTEKMRMLRRLLTIQPIEMIILCLSMLFILATITLIIIICRLRGFHLCLSMKNYLFYGRKYGLNQPQRLSSNKITQRVHSIVVRESQSPSISHIKSIEPYIFNINQYFEQEKIPSINLYPESSPDCQMGRSLSCTSSLDRGERTIDEEMKCASSMVVENRQLLQMITPNDDFDPSRLASEV